MVTRFALAAIVAGSVLGVQAPMAVAKAPLGDYVGETEKTAIGVAFGADGTLAYACDGDEIGTWFSGKALRGRKLVLRKGPAKLTLTVERGDVVARLGTQEADLRAAKGRAGLYRSENDGDSGKQLGGWVVQKSGRQVGVVASGAKLAPAPKLSTTTLVAGSLVAAPVVDPSDVLPVVVDVADDGIDVSGTVTTSLLGPRRTAKWTRPNDDDAFIAVDPAALAGTGFALSSTVPALARGGLRVTRNGVTTTAVDGFHLLRLLDANGDGKLSALDSTYSALRGFTDSNANGNFGDTPGLSGGDLVQKMAEMNMQFLALQEATQQESRKFTAISNASSAAHDLLLAAIRSIK